MHRIIYVCCFLQYVLSLFGAVGLTVATVTMKPPTHLPDLFPVLVSAYSCGHFILFLIYFHIKQFTCVDDSVEEPTKNVKAFTFKKKGGLKSGKVPSKID